MFVSNIFTLYVKYLFFVIGLGQPLNDIFIVPLFGSKTSPVTQLNLLKNMNID